MERREGRRRLLPALLLMVPGWRGAALQGGKALGPESRNPRLLLLTAALPLSHRARTHSLTHTCSRHVGRGCAVKRNTETGRISGSV